VVAILVAALPQYIEKKHAALRAIDQIIYRERGHGSDFLCASLISVALSKISSSCSQSSLRRKIFDKTPI
jgi:hypothetical protein